MGKVTRAVIVGGKPEYEGTYNRIIKRIEETFPMAVRWVQADTDAITAASVDLVLISTDVCSHPISEAAMKQARSQNIATMNITRKWADVYDKLTSAGYLLDSSPAVPAPPAALPAPRQEPSAPSLPPAIEAVLERLVEACEAHQIRSLLFDLATGEVEWERVMVTRGRSSLTRGSDQ